MKDSITFSSFKVEIRIWHSFAGKVLLTFSLRECSKQCNVLNVLPETKAFLIEHGEEGEVVFISCLILSHEDCATGWGDGKIERWSLTYYCSTLRLWKLVIHLVDTRIHFWILLSFLVNDVEFGLLYRG